MISLQRTIALGSLSLLCFFTGVQAWADCGSPSGQPGEFKYIGTNLNVCRDTVWAPLTPATVVTAAAGCGEGAIEYRGGDLLACISNNWVRTSANSGVWAIGCPNLSAGVGQFYYGGGTFAADQARYFYCTPGGYKGIPY